MSARLAKPLIVLSLVSPTVAFGQDSLTVELRLSRIETQLDVIIAALDIDADTPAATVSSDLPAEFKGSEHLRFGFPATGHADDTPLNKGSFIVLHDDGKKVADWVAYHLTRDNLKGTIGRTNNFRPDPALSPGSRSERVDYRGSGYDRGHMAPAGAFRRSRTAMSTTFLMSNMAPQRPRLNRQVWRLLEEDVRALAIDQGSVFVFTGPIYIDSDSTRVEPPDSIGPNRVAVPTHFFKVLLVESLSGGESELFAFVLPNSLQPIRGVPSDFLISVDHVERLTGLDFFSRLEDLQEERLEATVGNWPFR